MDIIKQTQDLTYLKWSHIRSSSGTAGTFLKSESIMEDKKIYYKLSNFDPVNGVIGSFSLTTSCCIISSLIIKLVADVSSSIKRTLDLLSIASIILAA